jgi:hypothetical protein
MANTSKNKIWLSLKIVMIFAALIYIVGCNYRRSDKKQSARTATTCARLIGPQTQPQSYTNVINVTGEWSEKNKIPCGWKMVDSWQAPLDIWINDDPNRVFPLFHGHMRDMGTVKFKRYRVNPNYEPKTAKVVCVYTKLSSD